MTKERTMSKAKRTTTTGERISFHVRVTLKGLSDMCAVACPVRVTRKQMQEAAKRFSQIAERWTRPRATPKAAPGKAKPVTLPPTWGTITTPKAAHQTGKVRARTNIKGAK